LESFARARRTREQVERTEQVDETAPHLSFRRRVFDALADRELVIEAVGKMKG